MSQLPFLKSKVWPTLRKQAGVSKYGYSEEDDLIEQVLNDLMQAIESKDHKGLTQALKALIDCVMNKESKGPDAIDEKA